MAGGTVKKHSEVLRRAIKWVSEQREKDPNVSLGKLLSEAGPMFNLSPDDQNGLLALLRESD